MPFGLNAFSVFSLSFEEKNLSSLIVTIIINYFVKI
jgi:hypothetical protein